MCDPMTGYRFGTGFVLLYSYFVSHCFLDHLVLIMGHSNLATVSGEDLNRFAGNPLGGESSPSARARTPSIPDGLPAKAFNELFACLSAAELAHLSSRMVKRTYPKNALIIYEEDLTHALYIIQTGKVKITKMHANGREVIIAMLSHGDFFGEMSLIDDAPRSTNAVCKERSELLILRREDFLPILSRNSRLALNLMRVFSKRLREATGKIASLALMDVYGRIVQLFNELAHHKNGKHVIEDPLTQQDIANSIGASREMVCRILKDLVSGGYIQIDHRVVTIKKALPAAW